MSFRTPTLLLFAAAVLHGPAAAQDISGTWKVVGGTYQSTLNQTFTLVQDGRTLTGEVSEVPESREADSTAAPVPVPITDGTVMGGEFTFVITLDFGDGIEQRLYAGTFVGDSLQGTLRTFTGPSVPFTGKRGG